MSHDISGMQLCVVHTYVRALAYAHGTKLVSILCTPEIANYYCILARRVSSVTLLTRPFLSFCVGGAYETRAL